jgi:hypothetical protein
MIAGSPFEPPTLKPTEAQAQAPAKFMGTVSCGSSKCHGDTKPRAEYPRLNESLVWGQQGLHFKSFETLTNESLKSGRSPSKIAKNLNIAQPQTSDRCLACHALNVKPELRGPRFNIADGVQCEACHGPSENWLEPHRDKKDWSHEQSVKAGMHDTTNLLVHANKCVTCHLAIDADMVAAGHPDLFAFELDTFSASMPSHWRDRGGWFNTRVWAIGQTVALREAMKQLAQRASGNADEKLLAAAWLRARGHAAVLRHALSVAAPDSQKILDQRMAALTETMAKGGGERPKIAPVAIEVAKAMEQVGPVVVKKEFGKAGTQAIMQNIAADADGIAAVGIRGAQQAAMALDRLYNTYAKASGQKPDPELSGILDKMFAQIEAPAKFDPSRFAADVKEFQKKLK